MKWINSKENVSNSKAADERVQMNLKMTKLQQDLKAAQSSRCSIL